MVVSPPNIHPLKHGLFRVFQAQACFWWVFVPLSDISTSPTRAGSLQGGECKGHPASSLQVMMTQAVTFWKSPHVGGRLSNHIFPGSLVVTISLKERLQKCFVVRLFITGVMKNCPSWKHQTWCKTYGNFEVFSSSATEVAAIQPWTFPRDPLLERNPHKKQQNKMLRSRLMIKWSVWSTNIKGY